MPIVQADRLTRIGAALLRAAGASDEEANAVAVGCVNANLAGHDSHGVIAIPTYIDRIKAGHIVPGAKWTIVQESPTTTVIDGHWGFGFHVNAKAMALTIEKAKTANVAACTVFRQSHVGRLAAYPLMAMREGMIGIATADSGRSPKHRRAVRRPRGAARHQPDLDRGAVRSRGAVLSGHGDLGGRGRQDRARGRPRRGNPDRLDRRRRRTAHHRSHAIPQGRRAAAARRQRGLQGQRPGRDGRGAVRPAHRPRLRRRADRAAQ